jgi:hypothetical protein
LGGASTNLESDAGHNDLWEAEMTFGRKQVEAPLGARMHEHSRTHAPRRAPPDRVRDRRWLASTSDWLAGCFVGPLFAGMRGVPMGIKPALGWLALLLFTTTAQAEGTRDLIKVSPKTSKMVRGTSVAVTPKTKASSPSIATVAAASAAPGLTVIESIGKPRIDYEAEAYAGVPLDTPLAKERGFDTGLVTMVFEHQRRPAFRVGKERIRRVVRLAAESRAVVTVVRTSTAARPKDHIDVLDTEDGVILVDTAVQNAGMFTTSDVYVFARNATLDQRVGALQGVPSPIRDRLREALVAAEWAPTIDAKH